jgi:hypothetical protein
LYIRVTVFSRKVNKKKWEGVYGISVHWWFCSLKKKWIPAFAGMTNCVENMFKSVESVSKNILAAVERSEAALGKSSLANTKMCFSVNG